MQCASQRTAQRLKKLPRQTWKQTHVSKNETEDPDTRESVPPVQHRMAEPLSSPSLKVAVDPKKKSPSLSATERMLLNSSSELEDPSGPSDHEKGEGRTMATLGRTAG